MSNKTFRRTYLETGALKTYSAYLDPAGLGRQCIVCGFLEGIVGRKFTLADCQAADAQLDKRREYQRAYAIAHRQPGDLGPRQIPNWVRARQTGCEARVNLDESVAGYVTAGGRSPSDVANPANGAVPQGGALAGGRGRPGRKRVLHAMRNPPFARPPHHRPPDEAIHELPPRRAAGHRCGQSRVQHRQRLSHRASPAVAVAKARAARAATARPVIRGLG